jgi:hypothetical protein
MALLLVVLVLLFGVIAPVAAFGAGLKSGSERARREAAADERRELLDRMERAELSGQTALLAELSDLYRTVSARKGLPRG